MKKKKLPVIKEPLRDTYCGKLISSTAPAGDRCECSIYDRGKPSPNKEEE